MVIPELAGAVYQSGTPFSNYGYTTHLMPNLSHHNTIYSAGYSTGWQHTADGNLPHMNPATGVSTEDVLLNNYLDTSLLDHSQKLEYHNHHTLSMTPGSAQSDVLVAPSVADEHAPRTSSELPTTQAYAFPFCDDTRYHTPSLHGTPVFAETIKPLPAPHGNPSLFISPTQLVGPVEHRDPFEVKLAEAPRTSRSPRASARRRTNRSSRSASSGSNSNPASSKSSPAPARPSPEFISIKPRNLQVSPAQVPSPQYAAYRTNRWKCPHCPHVQTNRRSPDLKRHIATHLRGDTPVWVCCGVPYVNAVERGVPQDVLSESLVEFEGMLMVGGCMKSFSRRDALGRHLREGSCIGDPLALWQPGNRENAGAQ